MAFFRDLKDPSNLPLRLSDIAITMLRKANIPNMRIDHEPRDMGDWALRVEKSLHTRSGLPRSRAITIAPMIIVGKAI
jgi:hypothetical protein